MIPKDTHLHTMSTLDKHMLKELLLVCSALGSVETADQDQDNEGTQRFVRGENCLEWLQDLQRYVFTVVLACHIHVLLFAGFCSWYTPFSRYDPDAAFCMSAVHSKFFQVLVSYLY